MTITSNRSLLAKAFNTSLFFPLVWLDRRQRTYHGSPFSKKLSALLDRLDFGAQWDINPPHFIQIDIVPEDEPTVARVKIRVLGHMKRQEELGVIKSLGCYGNAEEADQAVAAAALAS